jgi:hypothetical protein
MVRARIPEGDCILLRLQDHEVYIQGLLGNLFNVPDDRDTKTDVGDKTAVHYIQMQPSGITVVDHVHFGADLQKIGG